MAKLFIITGRLTKDPEIRRNGKTPVAHIEVAENGFRGGKQTTDFFRLTAFGKRIDSFEKDGMLRIGRGDLIYATGEIRNNRYRNKDGVMVYGDGATCSSTSL